uniref:SigE family RNA polymerase sigma factor n=1 Tax=Kineococcus sp. SYSU DK018 TaxID=3383139 RepID=UPI003D7CCBDD
HGPSLLRTATLLTGSRAEAEDLLQDTLEVCFRRWPAQVEHPGAYLRTAMTRLAARRRPRWHRWLSLDGDHAAAGDEATRVDQRYDLLAALRQLPPRQRAVVVLRHWEGYSEAETADVLHCSIGTVKSHASRGLQRLRDLLPHLSPPPPDPPVTAATHTPTDAVTTLVTDASGDQTTSWKGALR